MNRRHVAFLGRPVSASASGIPGRLGCGPSRRPGRRRGYLYHLVSIGSAGAVGTSGRRGGGPPCHDGIARCMPSSTRPTTGRVLARARVPRTDTGVRRWRRSRPGPRPVATARGLPVSDVSPCARPSRRRGDRACGGGSAGATGRCRRLLRELWTRTRHRAMVAARGSEWRPRVGGECECWYGRATVAPRFWSGSLAHCGWSAAAVFAGGGAARFRHSP